MGTTYGSKKCPNLKLYYKNEDSYKVLNIHLKSVGQMSDTFKVQVQLMEEVSTLRRWLLMIL